MKNSFFSQFTPKEPKFFPLLKQLSEVNSYQKCSAKHQLF